MRGGHFLKDAAVLAGVGERTLAYWLAQGRKDRDSGTESEFLHLLQSVEVAELTPMTEALKTITTAVRTNWKAAAWFLQHRHPREWGTLQKREHSGPSGAPMEVKGNGAADIPFHHRCTPEQRAAVLKKIATANSVEEIDEYIRQLDAGEVRAEDAFAPQPQQQSGEHT